jgi:hypothetical protein
MSTGYNTFRKFASIGEAIVERLSLIWSFAGETALSRRTSNDTSGYIFEGTLGVRRMTESNTKVHIFRKRELDTLGKDFIIMAIPNPVQKAARPRSKP